MSDRSLALSRSLKEALRPRFVYAKFPIVKAEHGIEVCSTILVLAGKDISRLLRHSDECIILAATLGAETDRLIAYTQRVSPADAAVMDEAASNAIEDYCDNIQTELAQAYNLTCRYGCGYGDLPLDMQPKILSVLNAQRTIGLFCDRSSIMTPRKSVTAIWGIYSQPKTSSKISSMLSVAGNLQPERKANSFSFLDITESGQATAGCSSCLIRQECTTGCRRERCE